MEFKWRKWNRAIHRDVGYFFFAMSIVYGISGIALNHIGDWNPSYHVVDKTYTVTLPSDLTRITTADAKAMLEPVRLADDYRKIYLPDRNTLKIFIKGGSVTVNLSKGEAHLEQLRRIPLIYHFNVLHYNNFKKVWTWFSDAYAAGLVILAISGLFILKGKNGITRRGAWLTIAGTVIPIVLFLLYA